MSLFRKKELTRDDVALRIANHIINVDNEKNYPNDKPHWYSVDEMMDLLSNSPEYKRIMNDFK